MRGRPFKPCMPQGKMVYSTPNLLIGGRSVITDSFDNRSAAIINPGAAANRFCCDACIVTFSNRIRDHALQRFPCKQVAELQNATGPIAIYALPYRGKTFALYLTYLGASAAAGNLEEAAMQLDTKKFVVFGGAGCLNKEIAHGKVMVPDWAYRDEGTSYHYAPAADYIRVKNAPLVARFMEENGIPHVLGRTWTTDAFFRETRDNMQKRKSEGCISVEIECAALQAVCDFRGYELYYFLTSGDLLDAPKWDERRKEGQLEGTQHDSGHLDIALELAFALS